MPPVLRVLIWNLFHGRAEPPAGRSLAREFSGALASWGWDVALLQEVPPWWAAELARAAGAEHRAALTSRNLGLALRRALATRWPDAIKSNGGGANAVLSRLAIADHRAARLRHWPERRVAQLVRLENGPCLVNFHASTRPPLAGEELAELWRRALDFAGEQPLVLAGDLNLRQPVSPRSDVLHLAARDVDHVFARGLRLSALRRPDASVALDGTRYRLSDHPPLLAVLEPPVHRPAGRTARAPSRGGYLHMQQLPGDR